MNRLNETVEAARGDVVEIDLDIDHAPTTVVRVIKRSASVNVNRNSPVSFNRRTNSPISEQSDVLNAVMVEVPIESPPKTTTEPEPVERKLDRKTVEIFERVQSMREGVDKNGKRVKKGRALANHNGHTVTFGGSKLKITHDMIIKGYKELESLIGGGSFNIADVMTACAYSLQIADNLLNGSKHYKIELAVYLIRMCIDAHVPEGNRQVYHQLVESSMPQLLDTIEDAPGLLARLCCCKGQK
jgi:hypothetical protein